MKRIHFVGIKGVAMAALAVWAKEAGYLVTGSDVEEEFPTTEVLAKAKISIFPDFDPRNIGGRIKPDLVIYTGAHGGRENEEVVEAEALGIPTSPHGKALGQFMKDKKQISVAGSHGKTTTTAMIATVLSHADYDPSWAVGCGQIRGLGLPGHYGKGEFFIAEADEYVTDPGHDTTPRFLWQHPDILVVTNIDYDHPDAYVSLAAVQDAFVKLQEQSKLTLVNADDPASNVLMNRNVMTYGFSKRAEFQVTHVGFGEERTFFTLAQNGMRLFDFVLKVPGKHNALNATAAAIACKQLGLSWQEIAKGFLAFEGTKRRFEFVGTFGGARVYDDYAHHPTEITAQLAAVRQWFPNDRIIAVFQPHTYSRTKALLAEFATSFVHANEVILTDIYASARETETLGISGKTLVEETAKYHQHVFFAPDFAAVQKLLTKHTQSGDVIIFMGAGSIYTWSHSYVEG
ncbi:MAG: UDP-N-acetylmuramate-L-alanine ligase [Microgenomates group bacterium GW2011_GWC1_49_7]|nr:MAG: UDP-N-acetylmuramate-L-alanine ligase [Microgenomates group bacterium GW2011_GWC1_49_7]